MSKKKLKRHQKIYNVFFKRGLDFLFALIILILTSPFLLLSVIFIKIDSKGPVLFTQDRVGKDSEVFKIYKLRTMDTAPFDEYGNKRRDRERITRSGKIIRKLSLDELPQLINILKGQMSFIGPRPLLIRYLPYYTDEEMRRHDVLPGISGLAQVNGRGFLNWEERFAYDVEYVDNISFKMDMHVLFKTIVKVFTGEGTSAVKPKEMVDFDQHRSYKKLR